MTSQPSRHTHKYRLIIAGNPNAGKSVIFHWLTGRYATVSNYPGTTVMLTRDDSTP